MKKFITHFGKTAALALLCCGGAVNGQAQSITIRTLEYPEEFRNLVYEENYESRAKFIFGDSPEFTRYKEDGSNWPTISLDRMGRFMLPAAQRVVVETAGKDSITIYYRMRGKNFHIDNGAQKVAVEDLAFSFAFNPLDVSRQVVIQSPKDREGQEMLSNIYLVNSKNSQLSALSNRPEAYPKIKMHVDKGPFHYIVCPLEKPYFMYEGVAEGHGVDTLTADYRKAKEVHFRVKGPDGEFMKFNTVNTGIHFNNKFSSNESLWGSSRFERNGQYFMQPANETDVDPVVMYAMPNDYYFSFWGLYNLEKKGYPAGLEGVVHIDNRDVQELVYDYNRYITLRANTNMEMVLKPTDLLFSRKNHQPNEVNKLKEHVRLDEDTYSASSYVFEAKDEQGRACTKIWAPYGYDVAEVRGNYGKHDFVLKDMDIVNQKDFALDVPEMGVLRVTYPCALFTAGADLMFNDEVAMRNKYARLGTYSQGEIERIDTAYIYNEPEKMDVSMLLETETDTFRTAVKPVEVIAGDTVDVSIKLDHAVSVKVPIYFRREQRKFDFSLVGDEGLKVFSPGASKGEFDIQTLYLFTGSDKCAYAIKSENMVPVEGSLAHADTLLMLKPNYDEYQQFTVSGSYIPSEVMWKGEDGREYNYIFRGQDHFFYAAPGSIAFNTSVNEDIWAMASYAYKVDFNKDIVCQIPDPKCLVSFHRGEEELHLWDGSRQGKNGEVKLYTLNHPYVDGRTPLSVFWGQRSEKVLLAPGEYCAEDGKGNKVTFKVVTQTTMDVDFPDATGVEGVGMDAAVPAAYYDACGRRLEAPRKGMNILRMKDGSVRKVMMR